MSDSNPLVSIVIPCYNHEEFVQESIQSVIDQTYTNIELIIIDDGSKDSSVQKIEQMVAACKQRFSRFEFRHRPNKGLSATLNEALEWCEGKYFSPLASDDVLLNDKTRLQVEFLESNSQAVALSAGVELIDEVGESLSEKVKPSVKYDHKSLMMHKFYLPAASQMIRTKAVKEVEGYNPSIKLEDWYMWIKLSRLGEIYYIGQVMALYRQHDNNFSKNKSEMWQGRVDVLNCFKDSPYYKPAMKRIQWLNARSAYRNSEDNRIKSFLHLLRARPFKALNMVLIDDPIKKLKGK